MPNIKSVSDLSNYNEILKDVSVGKPVFLTKNGKVLYAVIDIEEYEKITAALKLISALEEGERSARENGWMTLDDVKKGLGTSMLYQKFSQYKEK